MQSKTTIFLFASTLLALPALADFSYQETTRITGGSMVKMMKMVPGGGKALDPQTSQIYLKGNKLASVSQDAISIMDLDAETMTSVDLQKKTYAVITFQEMAQALEAAKAKMEAEMKKQNRGQQGSADMSFSVKVNETGQRKRISGYDTKEMEMLMEMQMKNQQNPQVGAMQFDISMWMTPEVDGYDEVRRFYLKMAEKLAWNPKMAGFAGAMSMQPGMSEGMAEMMKEVQKLEGVAILQVTTMRGGAMGAMGDMPSLSEAMRGGRTSNSRTAEDVVADEARRSASNEAARQASRSTGGRLGGLAGAATSGVLGGFGRRKKQEPKPEPQPEPQAAPAASGQAGAFMEMTSESSNFSTAAVDPARFAVPAGFRQVEHDMKKLLK